MFDDTPLDRADGSTPDAPAHDGSWLDLTPGPPVHLPTPAWGDHALAPGGGGLDALEPPKAPLLPPAKAAALDERHFRGFLEAVRRDETVPKGLQTARHCAGLLLFLAALPVLIAGATAATMVFIWTRTGIGILMGIGQRLVDLLRPRDDPKRGRDGGLAMRFRVDDAHRTVKAHGYVLGPVEEGDELEVWTDDRRGQLFLRRAVNHTQAGREVRPPREPWPLALASMLAWTACVALWLAVTL